MALKNSFLKHADRLFALPGWLLTLFFVRVIHRTHAWSDKSIPLKRWTKNRTALMRQFDVAFWIGIVMASRVTYLLINT